jgi:hypothetical protein
MDAGEFQPGPMARLADEIIQRAQGFEYSYLTHKAIVFVHKSELNGDRPKALLVGKKRSPNSPEDKYFLRNAATLARKAIELGNEKSDSTLSILFRDADRPSEYEPKRQSIKDGFSIESYPTGVAMIPLPASEAWLISSMLGSGEKLDGKKLEEWTDKYQLKDRLGEMLGGVSVRELNPDPDSISPQLESYAKFKSELEDCVRTIFRDRDYSGKPTGTCTGSRWGMGT